MDLMDSTSALPLPDESTAQLSVFLRKWTDLQRPPRDRNCQGLAMFLREVGPLLVRPRTGEPQKSSGITSEGLTYALNRLQGPIAQARQRGHFSDIWAVAGLGRNEVRTAGVLAWLLNTNGSHGRGDGYLQALWARIEGHKQLGFALNMPQSTLTENCPLGDEQNRVDITLEGADYLVLIEVKIDAPQSPRQVERYAKVAKAKATILNKKHWAVLYLCELRESLPENCLSLKWRDVAQAIKDASRSFNQADLSTQLACLFAAHVESLHGG